MVWHTDTDGRPITDDEGRDPIRSRQDQRERTGPEGLGQHRHPGIRDIGPHRHGVVRRDVHDQRMTRRAALCREDPGDCPIVSGIGGQAVHGLGRDGDRAAVCQDPGREFGVDWRDALRDHEA